MLAWFKSLRNAVDFPLRRTIKWSRGAPPVRREGLDHAYAHLPENEAAEMERRASELIESHGLQDFKANCSLKHYTINLFYLEMLERTFAEADYEFGGQSVLSVADIGPGSWIYAPAFHSFLSHWRSPERRRVELIGYEIDAYRIFNDMRSRLDHIKRNIDKIPDTSIVTAAFQERREHFDLVTLFYPFVLVPDHLDWGLPRSAFEPQKLLEIAWSSVRPGGALFVANQGPEEFEEQKRLFDECGITKGVSRPLESDLHPYEIPRFAHLRIKAR